MKSRLKKLSIKYLCNHRIQKLISIVVMTFAIIFQTAVAGVKVAVIVDGDDTKNLGSYFQEGSDETARVYEKNGFKVVRIDATKGMGAKEFRNALGGLKNVDELAITFYTHGVIINEGESFESGKSLNSEQKKRFPKSFLRKDEVLTQYGPEFSVSDQVRFAFSMDKNNQKPNDGWIGLGDLHDALLKLRSENPNIKKTKITALSCFGSNITRALQDMPDVEVFTGSAPGQVTDVFSESFVFLSAEQEKAREESVNQAHNEVKYDKISSFTRYFFEDLGKGNSYLESHANARTKHLDNRFGVMDFYRDEIESEKNMRRWLIRPQSSMELLLADQCLGNPPKTEVVAPCVNSTAMSLNQDVLNFGTESVFPLLRSFLEEQMTQDNRYLEKVSAFLACDKNQKKQEEEIFKKSIQDAKVEWEKRLKSLSQKDFELAAKKEREKIKDLDEVKSVKDFLAIIEDDPNAQELVKELKSNKSNMTLDSLASSIENLKNQSTFEINRLLLPETYSELKATISSFISEVEKKDSAYNLCLKSPLSCDLKNALPPFDLPQPRFDRQVASKAKVHLFQKCPSLEVGKKMNIDVLSARKSQLNCIVDSTKNDPYFRPYVLLAATINMNDNERIRACELFASERQKNLRLNKCLENPQNLGGSDFWEKMNSLYVNGLQNIR